MNGIHDMGGMQGMGPVQHEANEPVFHAEWEGRVFAINAALRAMGLWNLDTWRYQIESLAPVDYLRLTYYERWLRINEELVAKHGLLASGSEKAVPALTAAAAAQRLGRGVPSSDDPAVKPQFTVGEQVRARNINPVGHTRLPRYARGKAGVVARDHGVYTFPDTNAHLEGEHRQHVYSVRFAARELWGEQAVAKDSVYIDMWDGYLEHA
jgi:nitrile hydratase subunit beta